MTTGSRIRALRESRGMTQRQLAERAGCTDAAIRNYEAGRRALKGSALDAIAGALGGDPEGARDRIQGGALEHPPVRLVVPDGGVGAASGLGELPLRHPPGPSERPYAASRRHLSSFYLFLP